MILLLVLIFCIAASGPTKPSQPVHAVHAVHEVVLGQEMRHVSIRTDIEENGEVLFSNKAVMGDQEESKDSFMEKTVFDGLEYGTKIALQPTVQPNGSILVKINIERSSLNTMTQKPSSQMVDGTDNEQPGVATLSFSKTVLLQDGEKKSIPLKWSEDPNKYTLMITATKL